MDIITFLMANADGIFAALAALHGLAVAVVNLTPTPADDKLVGKAYKVIEVLAGIFSFTAKEIPGEREVIKAQHRTAMESVDDWLDR
jgi:hypothetical protein